MKLYKLVMADSLYPYARLALNALDVSRMREDLEESGYSGKINMILCFKDSDEVKAFMDYLIEYIPETYEDTKVWIMLPCDKFELAKDEIGDIHRKEALNA